MVVLAGLPAVRFDFFSTLCSRIRTKNTPLVSQRGIEDDSILFSVNCYPFLLVTIDKILVATHPSDYFCGSNIVLLPQKYFLYIVSIISARERSAFADATAITSFPPTGSSRAASTVWLPWVS